MTHRIEGDYFEAHTVDSRTFEVDEIDSQGMTSEDE